MNLPTLQARLAARQAKGMTADQYNAYLQGRVAEARVAVRRSVAECIREAINGARGEQLDHAHALEQQSQAALAAAEAAIQRGYE